MSPCGLRGDIRQIPGHQRKHAGRQETHKAGEQRGLSVDIASTISRETVLGTAWMAASTGESMDEIARRVASPKGTTEAGLTVLDHDAVLDQLIAVTIEAAAKRGAELADEARAVSSRLTDVPQTS